MKPKLIMMCGLSGSGKSTISKELSEKHNAIIVSSDEIRKEICGCVLDQSKNDEVFRLYHKRIREYLIAGKNVIADATNITMKSRRATLFNLKNIDIEKICYVVAKPFENCVIEDSEREISVRYDVIKKQVLRFQIPFMEEGFDNIIIHKLDNKYAKAPCSKRLFLTIGELMEGFDQKNPHHKYDLGEHCVRTLDRFKTLYGEDIDDGFLIGILIHDLGKKFTQTFDEDGIAHYYGHANRGSYFLLSIVNPSTLRDDTTKILMDCCFVMNYHMLPYSWNDNKTHDKYKKIFGEEKYDLLIKVHECDKAAS